MEDEISNRRIINPRLIDCFNVDFAQDDVDFLIPHLKEDIPLYIDPFLMWASDNPVYQDLHNKLLVFFDYVRWCVRKGAELDALRILVTCQEPREFGLGYSIGTKCGSTIGRQLAQDIINLYLNVPKIAENGLSHIEVVQLCVPNIAEDRISDIAACILKDYFIKYTTIVADEKKIPTKKFLISNIWDNDTKKWKPGVQATLPFNPYDGSPLILVPLNLLRHLPWINYEDYYRSHFSSLVLPHDATRKKISKEKVLEFNNVNYREVEGYIKEKEAQRSNCKPDPFFRPLQIRTIKEKLRKLRSLPTGLVDNNDKIFEDLLYEILSTLMYPELEFAAKQIRTISGSHIRDIIFYNDGKTHFLDDMRKRYGARQIVFELKNVRAIEREHVNQIHRYLDDEFGSFGILVTRNPLPKSIQRNIVDLHSSKRVAIIAIDDSDIDLMINLLESGRRPIEAIKKKFIDFTRQLPK